MHAVCNIFQKVFDLLFDAAEIAIKFMSRFSTFQYAD